MAANRTRILELSSVTGQLLSRLSRLLQRNNLREKTRGLPSSTPNGVAFAETGTVNLVSVNGTQSVVPRQLSAPNESLDPSIHIAKQYNPHNSHAFETVKMNLRLRLSWESLGGR